MLVPAGGETRLVSIPFGCSAQELFSTLERATSSFSDSGELRSDFVSGSRVAQGNAFDQNYV